jgi:hypothetical protein
MYVKNNFKKLADIDTTLLAYTNFSNALLNVDWGNAWPSSRELSYAPGFSFANIPFMNNHSGFKAQWHATNNLDNSLPADMVDVRNNSLAFFSMIESLVPNHRVIRVEILTQKPKGQIDRKSEYNGMHIDHRIFHRYSKRCQVSIATNNDAFLNVAHDRVSIPLGSLYEFNNKEVHWGVNYGNSIRIVTVIDLLDTNVWDNLDLDTKYNFFESDDKEMIAINNRRTTEFKSEFKQKHGL